MNLSPRFILCYIAIILSVVSFFVPLPVQVITLLLGVAMLLP